MLKQPDVPRRAVLAGAGALAGAAALAACGSDEDDTGGSAGSSAPADRPVATLSDIPVGQGVAAKDASGKPIIVARPTEDTAVAFSAICTHMGCTVAPAGAKLACPCHGSVFNATTGAVSNGPAARPLPGVDVHVEDGRVLLGSPPPEVPGY